LIHFFVLFKILSSFMSLYVPYYRTYNKHNTNIHAPGGIFFLPVRCFSPLIHFFVLFKSFRPSCHFMFHATVIKHNTNIHAPGGIRTHDPSKRAA
jgi:hypothetical protein